MARDEPKPRSSAAGQSVTTAASGFPKLTIATLALLVAGLGVISSVPRPGRRRSAPAPAKSVDLNRYLGRWYEFARYDAWFERGCEAATAEYSLRPDGLIRIVNACRKGGLLGPLRWAEAKAKVLPKSGNAKLKVAFFGPFFWGDYWILDHAEDYSWSIVGAASRRYLWILTRQPVPPPEIQSLLIGRVQALGYNTMTLHMTRQLST